MNIHVILVHFPVALLTIYSLFELARFRKFLSLPYWFYVKGTFVILGALGALGAFLTGDAAAMQFNDNATAAKVIDMHSTFGAATVILFGIIAALYLLAWLGRSGFLTRYSLGLRIVTIVEKLLASWTVPVAALLGLVLVTITGALGGAIAFGPDVDPVSKLVYNWFNF